MTQEDMAHIARTVLLNRRDREAHLSAEIFADHAWEALLHLFVADIRGQMTAVSQLADLVRCSERTMRRWLAFLAADGLVAVDDDDVLTILAPARAAVAEYVVQTSDIARSFVERERAEAADRLARPAQR